MRLLKLVNALLDFSRIEAGRVHANLEPTDLARYTAELCGMFRAAIEKAGMRLVVDCPPAMAPVFVDRDMWEKIVLNLLSNAFKFTFEGEIRVEMRTANGAVQLRVIDTGLGIPEDELGNVFKRFHRVEGVRGRTFEGSGIGLALVQELVKLHGGGVEVKSAVGVGTEFRIFIPLGSAHLDSSQAKFAESSHPTPVRARAFLEEALRWLPDTAKVAVPVPDIEGASAVDTTAPFQAGHPSKTARILVADDNADMRDYVRRLLAPKYDVITATDGESALANARDTRPDLILTDIMMPRLDGFGLLQAVRSDERLRTVPVILLSARAGEESRVEGLDAGADDYLIKPFSARELVARVESHLNMARFRQEAFKTEQALRDEVTAQTQKAQEILQRISDGFFALDENWRFTYLNQSAERLLGKSAAELLGKSHWDVYPTSVGTFVEHEFRRARSGHATVQFESFYASWNRWFEVKAYPWAKGLAVHFRDITDHKLAADELSAAHTRLAEQVEGLTRLHQLSTQLMSTRKTAPMLFSIVEGIAALHRTDKGLLFLADESGEFLHAGASLGFDPRALEKLNLIPSGMWAVGTAFAERRRVIVEDTEAGKLNESFREFARASGIRAVHSTPILARNGRALGVLSVYFNVPSRPSEVQIQLADMYARQAADFMEQAGTDRALRKRESELQATTKALQVSEERFRLAAFSEAITLYEQDAQLRYLWLYPVHPEHQQALGKSDWEILQNEQGENLEKWKREVMSTGEPQRRETWTDLPGGPRVYDLFILPRRNSSGEIIGVAGTALDITARKQAEAALRESEQRLAAELRGTTLLYELGNECANTAMEFNACLDQIVQVAISLTAADKANLQLLDPETGQLHIAAHQGFEEEFLEHFAGVHGECGAACAAAMEAGRRIIVEDVTCSPVFAGTRSLEIMLKAGARAVQSTPLISSAGNLLGMISTHYGKPHRPSERQLRMIDLLARQAADYLERCQVEEALRQSEVRMRTLAESLPNLVWTCLPDGSCDWLSSQWRQYTGVAEAELLGFNWVNRVIHPDDRQKTLECWNAARTGRGEYNLEYRIRRRDGEYHWFKTRGVPMRDPAGKIVNWFGTCTDIQDMKQAELAVQRLAAIVEHSDDAILSIDLEGTIQSWNMGAERLYGYTCAEVIGGQVTMLMPENCVDQHKAIMASILTGQSIENCETQRRRKDGTLFDVSLTVSPVKDSDGRIVGVSKVARDITDKVRAKEKLEQTVSERTASLREAIAQMEEFSYSVSHDLRSPVRAMQGYATALAEDFADQFNEESRNYLDRIIQASVRMERLIHDVLTYTRVSRTEMKLEAVSLGDLLEGIVAQYPDLSSGKADIILSPNLGTVLAHEPALGQVLANLLNNAVKFVAPGVRPRVEISSERSNEWVKLRVRDNGIGIKPEHQSRLFGMFERIHPDGRYEGTGIGLAMVRKAIERMGGRVGVESDGVNGSTFWIQLQAGEPI